MHKDQKPDFFLLSSEGKAIRRNLLLFSVLAGFIGLTNQFPTKVSLLGMDFGDEQQSAISWLIFAITTYFWTHFIAIAAIEFSVFLKPKVFYNQYKKRLLKHPAFDETDFLDIAPPADQYDLAQVQDEAHRDANYAANRMMKPLELMTYLKLGFDVVLPFILPLVALFLLYRAII